MNKAMLIVAALLVASPPTLSQEAHDSKGQEAQRSEARPPASVEPGGDRDAVGARSGGASEFDLRSRMNAAIETVGDFCADDIREFCGNVTPGGGRLAMCMRAYEDQFGRRCRAVLEGVSRAIDRSARRVTEMCWNEVRDLCGDADRVGQCVVQKKASLSPLCQTIVAVLGQRTQAKVQGLMAEMGMPIYSSDDKAVGQVARVIRGPDGNIQSLLVDTGRMMGLGSKVVTIAADKFEPLGIIKLRLSDSEVRSLPETKQ
jgi:hypothetical protein